MIRFFRTLRQNLLAENRLGRYLLYGIGEIVLVVIGILIALQINTWNENRNRQKLKASYQTSLINDLSLDTLILGRMIDENNRFLNTLSLQRQRILGPQTPFDTLVKIVRDEFDPELNTRFKYHRNTLNTLIASGNIDLFAKELNDRLMTLISDQDQERENANYYLDIYSRKISRFTDDFPVSRHQNSSIVNALWADVDNKKLASGFISLTDIKGFAHYKFIDEIEKIKAQTILLLEQLNTTD